MGGGTALVLFALDTNLLNAFGQYFGVARGADLLVYVWLIILMYLYISLLNVREKDTRKMVELTRNMSLSQSKWSYNDARIIFVIPSYNESNDVLGMIRKILDWRYGVVFIDDWSTNNLYDKAIDIFKDKNFVWIKHILNIGQWGALQTWFSYILQNKNKVTHFVTFDADGQHQLEDVETFIQAFSDDKELDIVLGSRFLGKTVNMPKIKKVTLKIGILFTRVFSQIKLTDTHNGYRMIKISTLPNIQITLPWFEHASQIIDIIQSKKLKYKEIPITVIYSEYSMAKWQKLWNALRIVREMIYNKLFFR